MKYHFNCVTDPEPKRPGNSRAGPICRIPYSAMESVARWLSTKYRTLAVSVSVACNIELLTQALSGTCISITIPDKEPKYRTVRLNTGHLAMEVNGCIGVNPGGLDPQDFGCG